MASLGRGESSSVTNPILDIFTGLGNPSVLTDVAELRFAIRDISTPAKKAIPVQVFPVGPVGTFFELDPANADPGPGPNPGVRLGVGHYFAPFTVAQSSPIGDHQLVWEFRHTALSPLETSIEEFFVTEGANPTAATYCGVADIRAEGFLDPPFSDARIDLLAELATRYIDKVTGRWFTPRTFDSTNPFKVDGKDGRTLHLMIPIIRIDKLEVETQGFLNPDRVEIEADNYRVYNRHLFGVSQPDDRENPRITYVPRRIVETIASGLFPAPLKFVAGRQNIFLEGVFGYTDWDGTPGSLGETPRLIRQVACRLVARDLCLDVEACKKLNIKNRFRFTMDKEGKNTVRLQDLWLRGSFTGDPEIDNILMAYRRPARMAAI